jgi:hypothetical protein
MRLSGARTRRPRALWDLPSGQCLLDHVPRVEGTAAAGMANAHGLAAQWDLHVLSVADAAMRFVLVSAATGRVLESTADGIVRTVPLAGRDAHEWEVPCQVRCRGGRRVLGRWTRALSLDCWSGAEGWGAPACQDPFSAPRALSFSRGDSARRFPRHLSRLAAPRLLCRALFAPHL